MSKRLLVMRHAKSSWEDDVPTDHARPLNKRGQRDASAIAKRLVELDWMPNLVLTSDATRARETYALMSSVLDGVERVEYIPAFYSDGFAALRATIGEIPANYHTVLAVGHNPCWEEALFWLAGESVVLTTANCALLESDAADWEATVDHRKKWRLVDVVRPKEL